MNSTAAAAKNATENHKIVRLYCCATNIALFRKHLIFPILEGPNSLVNFFLDYICIFMPANLSWLR